MMLWIAVLGCSLGCYLLKLAGLSVPPKVLEKPLVDRASELLPVVLLAGLIAVQVFAGTSDSGGRLVLDARLVGLGAAFVALLLRAPFIVVVLAAAVSAALVRLL